MKKKFTSFTPLSDKKMLLSVEKYKKANDDNSSENKDLMNSNREKDNNSLHFEGGDDKEKVSIVYLIIRLKYIHRAMTKVAIPINLAMIVKVKTVNLLKSFIQKSN